MLTSHLAHATYLEMVLLNDVYCLKFLTLFDCDFQAFFSPVGMCIQSIILTPLSLMQAWEILFRISAENICSESLWSASISKSLAASTQASTTINKSFVWVVQRLSDMTLIHQNWWENPSYIHVSIHLYYINVYLCLCVCVCMCSYIYLYTYLHLYIYIYIYIYIYRQQWKVLGPSNITSMFL